MIEDALINRSPIRAAAWCFSNSGISRELSRSYVVFSAQSDDFHASQRSCPVFGRNHPRVSINLPHTAIREVQRKMHFAVAHPKAISALTLWLERAARIQTQQRNDKNKFYALHATEVECIGKGKARKPYEFGVKSAVVVSHEHGQMLGARTFLGTPYDGHIRSAVLEQATNLTKDVAVTRKHIVVDLGFRGVNADNPDKKIINRGSFKSLSKQQKGWLKRRTAVEPAIGHLKSDHRMDRCWLQGASVDALHPISCAAGYNLRWLMRAIVRLGITPAFLRLLLAVLQQPRVIGASRRTQERSMTTRVGNWLSSEIVKKPVFGHLAWGA